jgi:hypothetical protein
VGERLYQHRPYMIDGMYVVGVKPKSLGEGVIPVVYTMYYEKAWAYWDHNFERELSIYQWNRGGFKPIGRRIQHKDGRIFHVPVPPPHVISA